jgi:Tfp pilus assembly protein PilN
MFQVILENRNLQRQIAETDRQITSVFKQTFPEVTRIVDPVAQMRAGIDRIKNQNVLAGETGVDIRNIDILKDISQLIPANTDIVITRFVRGDNSVQIAGLTDTFNEVDDIKMQLEKSALFSQITISSANMDKSSNRVRFRIRIDLAGMEP